MESNALTFKQYLMVNLSKMLIEFFGSGTMCIVLFCVRGRIAGVLLSLWIMTLFFYDMTGAHFNPCITLAVMLRRNSKFGARRLKGLLYMAAQFMGAIAGALTVQLLWRMKDEEINKRPRIETFNTIISEILGTFIYVLFFLVSTNKSTQYSKEKAMNCLVIASSYVGAMMIAGGGMVTYNGPLLNPFISFGLCLWSGKWGYWQYFVFPWVGALAGLIFYELVFVRTLEYLADGDPEDEDNDLELDLDDEDEKKQKKKGEEEKLLKARQGSAEVIDED